MGGLLEGVAHWIYQLTSVLSYAERFHPVDLNVLWTSPLIDISLFVVVACVLLPILWILRTRVGQLEVIVFTALVCSALLFGTGRTRMPGAVVFAIGLGTVASRWVRRDPLAVIAFFRRSLIPLLCIALLTFGAVQLGDSIWQKVQVARLPEAPPNAPNVLLIVLDTLRADRLSTYGYARPTTPFLDEYAQRGVLFERAFANSSWTMPSHTSLFTGRFPFQHGVDLWAYDGRFATLAQVMGTRGYATVGFSANEWPCTRASGLGVGFIECESLFNGPLDTFLRSFYGRRVASWGNNYFDEVDLWGRPSAEEINRRFLGWLDRRPKKPFFAFLNYMEAHGPYHPLVLRADRKQSIPADYDTKVTRLDAQLRKLFDELRTRGLEQNLVVIITADHGQSLGEHGVFGHRSTLYLEQIHVPLLVVWHGKIPPNLRVSNVVGLQAVPGTISELARLGKGAFPGGSLSGCWAGGACGDESVLSELSFPESKSGEKLRTTWIKSLITSRRHFILEQNGQVELYDWPSDPRETRNLADTPEERSSVEALGTKMVEIVPQAAAAWAIYTGKGRVAARGGPKNGTQDVRE
jgi:arylsulfatase A-like enzyme